MIRLVLPLPPSANVYWRHTNGRTFVSHQARSFLDEVHLAVAGQGLSAPLSGNLEVKIDVYRQRRSGDLDNRIKVLLDALQGRAYLNDSQVVRIVAERHDDKENPRVEVEIKEIEDGEYR